MYLLQRSKYLTMDLCYVAQEERQDETIHNMMLHINLAASWQACSLLMFYGHILKLKHIQNKYRKVVWASQQTQDIYRAMYYIFIYTYYLYIKLLHIIIYIFIHLFIYKIIYASRAGHLRLFGVKGIIVYSSFQIEDTISIDIMFAAERQMVPKL